MSKLNLNAKLRVGNAILLGITVLGALVGWFLGHDPTQLIAPLGAVTGTQAALEAAMVGKRATYKKEAVDA